jgi:type II secretory pathway predicted ATPase ExeA
MDNVIRFPAEYKDDIPQEYIGNPYIEALPELLEMRDFFQLILHLPTFDATFRDQKEIYRKVKVAEIYKYVVPNQHFYDLYCTLWRMLFTTYSDRNSLDVVNVKRQYSILLLKKAMDDSWKGTTGESLLITAPSGFGKTFMVKRVLQSLTQVVDHTEYKNKPFRQPQVLWIYLKIPSNANRKSLCHLFLQEIDNCVGTDYAVKTPMSTQIGNYERMFRTIIETYKVGLLVVDEIQNLSVSKAGGDQEFLNFFSELSEQWRMGLILIGTPNIIPTLEGTFTASRRLTSGGDIHFTRYAQTDPFWRSLVTTLWPYQYVANPSKLYNEKREITNHALFDEIYKLTQGIPFVFAFLFVHAQFIVIEKSDGRENEQLGIAELRKAYNTSSRLIKSAIEDIRANGGENYPDLMQQALMTVSPAKTQFIIKLQELLDKQRLSTKVVSELRKEIKAVEEKYVLNEDEQKIVERIKQLKCFLEDDPDNRQAIEGQFKEVR